MNDTLTLPISFPDPQARAELLLDRLGLSPRYRGFRQLSYGVRLVYENRSLLSGQRLTSAVYPAIARAFGVSPAAVERNIRTAINVIWNNCDPTLLWEIAGHPVRAKPSNGDMIRILCQHLSKETVD